MSQSIEATVSIKIPDDQVIVSKTYLKQLETEQTSGKLWSFDDLRINLFNGKAPQWVREHVLTNSKLRGQLDSLRAKSLIGGGGVGKPWWFQAQAMREFVQQNWSIIFNEED
ncbi:DUF771 domain-containing protein [Furfurilactobacillus sp. WILCCON 0119]